MGRESIRAAALALPEDERAKLASELLASVEGSDIDDQAEVDAAWARELELRAERADADPSTSVPLDQALAELRSTLRQK